jgi:2,3-bisphosphoglycerate-dependent phosphoglycerate mutase
MATAIEVENIATELGNQDFVHGFFSTISCRLENGVWGSKFPILMTELYQGTLKGAHASAALSELRNAKTLLAKFPPKDVVWDIEDLSASPPWGDNIASDITNLSNYFVTSTGRDMFDVVEETLEYAAQHGKDCKLLEV